MRLYNQIRKKKKVNLDTYLTPYTYVNSKQIKYLNKRAKTLTFSEESIEINLCDFGLGNGLLDMTPKA